MDDGSEQSVCDSWGDDISEERKAALKAIQVAWADEAKHKGKPGPFASVVLSGADVYWLASQTPPPVTPPGIVQGGNVPNRSELHLEGANLRRADLRQAQLYGAHLEGAVLFGAHLEGATLSLAHLEQADLWMARVQGATLTHAHLEGIKLWGARLEGANLGLAHLEGACLVGAALSKTTRLNGAYLSRASLDQVDFGGTNLAVVEWRSVHRLGDELIARQPVDQDGKRKPRSQQINEYQAATRAYRQLAAALLAQRLSDEGDRFAFRARILARQVLWLEAGLPHWGRHYPVVKRLSERVAVLARFGARSAKFGEWLVSWLLDVVAGYGFRLGRILVVYVLALFVFMAAYLVVGAQTGAHLQWYQALLVSLTAIHGRVFFEQFGLNSPLSWVAAVESVVGIVIEGVFVAVLVQRFFGSR